MTRGYPGADRECSVESEVVMTVQINLPASGVRSQADFDNLPEVSPVGVGIAIGPIELTLMPVTFWHFRIVMLVLEHWLRLGHEVAGEQYVADSGFARGETGRNNFVADGVVFESGYRPAKNSTTHDATNIHTVIEAVSAGSEDRDAVDKVRVYAARHPELLDHSRRRRLRRHRRLHHHVPTRRW